MSSLAAPCDQPRIAADISFANLSQPFAALPPASMTMNPPIYSAVGATTTTMRSGGRTSAPPALTLKCSNTPRVRFSPKLAIHRRQQSELAGPHSSWPDLSVGEHVVREMPTDSGISCDKGITHGYHLGNPVVDERQILSETKMSPRTPGSFGMRFKIPGFSSGKRSTNMASHPPQNDAPFGNLENRPDTSTGGPVQQTIQDGQHGDEPRTCNQLDGRNVMENGEKAFNAEMNGQQMDMNRPNNSATGTEAVRDSAPAWNKNAPLPPLPLRSGVNASPSNAPDLEWRLQSEVQKSSDMSTSRASPEMISTYPKKGIERDVTQSSISFYSDQFDQALDKIMELSQTKKQSVVVPISPTVQKVILDSLMKNAQSGTTPSAETSPNLEGSSTDQPKKESFIRISRKHSNDDGDCNAPDENGEGRLSKRPRHPDAIPTRAANGLRFGCPFHSHDPKNYDIYRRRSCASAGFESISRLKEHLYRHHMAPIHCIRCYCTFQTHEGLKSHLMAPKGNVCKIRTGQVMEGITEDLERQLKSRKKTTPRQTDKERWEDIYRLLFPNAEVVPSPYFEPLPQELLQPRISQKMVATSEFRGQEPSPEPAGLGANGNSRPNEANVSKKPASSSQGSAQHRARKLSSKPNGDHIALQLQDKQLGQRYEPSEPEQFSNPPVELTFSSPPPVELTFSSPPPVELTFSSPPPEPTLHYSPTQYGSNQGASIHRYSPSIYSDHGCDTSSSSCTCPSPCSCPLGDMPSAPVLGAPLYDFDYDYDYELMTYLKSNVGSVDYNNQPLVVPQEHRHELQPSMKPQIELPFAVEELYAKLNDLLESNNFSDSDASTSIGIEQDQWWS